MSVRKIFPLLLVLILVAYSLLADEENAPLEENSSREIYRLSLKEATELALLNNFDIQLAQYDAWIAQTKEGEARSIYDTIVEVDMEYRNNQLKKTSTIAGGKIVDNDYNIGFSKKIPTGTTLNLDMENSRNWTNSTVATQSLTHDSSLGIEIIQELGKNFLGIQDRGDVKLTFLDIESSQTVSLDKIEESIVQTQKAYWDLVLAKEKARISEGMLAQAKRLWELHQEKLKNGLVELSEVIAAEANYHERLNDYHLSLHELSNKSENLKLLLNVSQENIALDPKEDLMLLEDQPNFVTSLNQAIEHRQDYKKALNAIEEKQLKLSLKKNNLWPEVNLTASLKRNGLGDHFRQAVENITNEDNPEIFAGIHFEIPLENSEARAEWKEAELEKVKVIVALKLLERKIATDILNQVRDCQMFKESALTKARIADLQRRKFQEEEKRFYSGRSSTDILIRSQEDLIQAQWEQAQAKYTYLITRIDLSRKEGALLRTYWNGDL